MYHTNVDKSTCHVKPNFQSNAHLCYVGVLGLLPSRLEEVGKTVPEVVDSGKIC